MDSITTGQTEVQPRTRGQKLAAARRRLGLTQQQLADAIGKSKHYVWLLEKDRKGGSVSTLEDIADALGVGLDDLRAA